MFNWIPRHLVYITIKPDWLSVRVVRKNAPPTQYEDVPDVLIRRKAKSQTELLAFGSAAKAFPVNQNEEIFLVNGLKHPRSLISDFDAAEVAIKSFLRQALGQKRSISHVIIIHLLDKLEGGLTSVEQRAFFELGIKLGGTNVFIISEPFRLLSDQEILSIAKIRKVDDVISQVKIS